MVRLTPFTRLKSLLKRLSACPLSPPTASLRPFTFWSSAKRGLSLVEILIALAVFGVAMSGLLLAMQSVNNAIAVSMDRNVENAYTDMLVSQINPFDPQVESSYDVTTKTAYTLPRNGTVYYTRYVDSADTQGDVKRVNVYVFRSNSASATAYRRIRREISPDFVGYNLGETTAYRRDALGQVWAPLTITYASTSGSRQNGSTQTTSNYSTASTITGTPDQALFQKGHEANNGGNALGYTFLATQGQTYLVTLGFAEVAGGVTAGQRKMTITVNGSTAGTADPVSEAGANVALVKQYTASPTLSGSVYVITVGLTQFAGATLPPRLAYIGLKKSRI
jgi:prepilin-type N-terminal cleavage/methylation domain-containing protein